MADRGAAAAVDDVQYLASSYTHVQEATATFPEAAPAPAFPDASSMDVGSWVHPVDPPIDWLATYTTPAGGTGWYMTEAVSTDKKLQGAPNGSSQASGTLHVDMALTATVAARATVSSPAMAKAVALQATPNGASTIALNLRIARALTGQAAGAATVVGDLTVRALTVLTGTTAGVSTAIGDLLIHLGTVLTGTTSGASTATADLAVHVGLHFTLDGRSDGRSTVSAPDLKLPPFKGTAAGKATATAVVTVTYAFNITDSQPSGRARFYTAR